MTRSDTVGPEQQSRVLLERYRRLRSGTAGLQHPAGDLDSLAAESERAWVCGRRHNPTLQYPPPQPDDPAGDLLRSDVARAADTTGDWLLAAFDGFLQRSRDWGVALRSHDPELITNASSTNHGPLAPATVATARAILAKPERCGPDGALSVRSADEALPQIRAALQAIGAHGWEARIRGDMLARMSVSSKTRRVSLAGGLFTDDELARLLVHEIACHVARASSGEQQLNPLLALGIGPQHLRSEEGAAVWLEDQLGVLGESARRKYALRVLAVEAALNGSFSDTYAAVRAHTDAQQAFAITLRVKRGISDTSVAGAYVKDKVYLEGWQELSVLLMQEPRLVPLLWSGKISIPLLAQAEAAAQRNEIVVAADPRPRAADLLAALGTPAERR